MAPRVIICKPFFFSSYVGHKREATLVGVPSGDRETENKNRDDFYSMQMRLVRETGNLCAFKFFFLFNRSPLKGWSFYSNETISLFSLNKITPCS